LERKRGVAVAATPRRPPPASGSPSFTRSASTVAVPRSRHDGALGHVHDQGRRLRGRASSCPTRGYRSPPGDGGGRGNARSDATFAVGDPAQGTFAAPCRPSPPFRATLGHVGLTAHGHAARHQPSPPPHVDLALVDEGGHDGTAYGLSRRAPVWVQFADYSTRWTGSPMIVALHTVRVACGRRCSWR